MKLYEKEQRRDSHQSSVMYKQITIQAQRFEYD